MSSLRAVAALCSLPHGLPVAEYNIGRAPRQLLRRLPAGFVERVDDDLVRRVRTPLRIHGVVAFDDDWDRAATALGAYVTVCSRVAAVEPIDDRIRAEASVWGIGLVGYGGAVMAKPESPTIEVGPYQWWLAEHAYSAWLAEDQRRAHALI